MAPPGTRIVVERWCDLAVPFLIIAVAVFPAPVVEAVVGAVVVVLAVDFVLSVSGLVNEIRRSRRVRARYAAIARAYDL